jgi:hypothetical protein
MFVICRFLEELILFLEYMVQFMLGFCVVPVELIFSPKSSLLKRVAVQNMSFSNSSSGVDQYQPAGLRSVSSKLYGGSGWTWIEYASCKFKIEP